MSKKKESIILAEKPKFIKGCLDNGYDERTATEVYDLILKFANYGFNKSHSVSYAITAYKMAFIKTYFLKYFIAGILTNSIGNTSKINIYVNRARKSLIKILPPDINESIINFMLVRMVLDVLYLLLMVLVLLFLMISLVKEKMVSLLILLILL